MRNTFLSLAAQDRKLAFDDAALTLHLGAVILEKDFWVSWLLGQLFALPELAPFLVFKGVSNNRREFERVEALQLDNLVI